MDNIIAVKNKAVRPERIIQFGEGGFLRAFVDWMVQRMNQQDFFDGSIVVVQPIEKGMCDMLESQNCLYTQILHGIANGKAVSETSVVDCISRCVNPYTDFEAYLELAQNPEMRFIVSNTTEAGIVYDPNDRFEDMPPKSFPAKLTVLLYKRFTLGLEGFIILPCELIEANGSTLKSIIIRYAKEWQLGQDFIDWITEKNHFNNTLVDRIVTGYPKEDVAKFEKELGYTDKMINTGEIFHLWVIEGDEKQSEEIPFNKAGLNVVWTANQQPYRTRKVRILNGAHTALVPYAMLKGFDTVRSCIENEEMYGYLRTCIFDEIMKTLDLPKNELVSFAESVLERFANPYINHYLASIALNSVSKFKVRVLPSILEYIKRYNSIPVNLVSSLGYLIKFYRTDMANDDAEIMEFMKTSSTAEILANKDLWDEDLSFLLPEVDKYAD